MPWFLLWDCIKVRLAYVISNCWPKASITICWVSWTALTKLEFRLILIDCLATIIKKKWRYSVIDTELLALTYGILPTAPWPMIRLAVCHQFVKSEANPLTYTFQNLKSILEFIFHLRSSKKICLLVRNPVLIRKNAISGMWKEWKRLQFCKTTRQQWSGAQSADMNSRTQSGC